MAGHLYDQMIRETLDIYKGLVIQPERLDIDWILDAGLAPANLRKGMVGSRAATTPFGVVLGVGAKIRMPLFSMKNGDDKDLQAGSSGSAPASGTLGGNSQTDRWVTQPSGPAAKCEFLVASGAFELRSPQFDTTGSYPPDTLLTSPLTTANAGKLVAQALPGTQTICGQVSRGVGTNTNGYAALYFWTMVIHGNNS